MGGVFGHYVGGRPVRHGHRSSGSIARIASTRAVIRYLAQCDGWELERTGRDVGVTPGVTPTIPTEREPLGGSFGAPPSLSPARRTPRGSTVRA